MEITHEKACLCALNRIFGFEPKIALALISFLGNATEVFALDPGERDRILGPHSKHRGCMTGKALAEAYAELERLKSQGITFIGYDEAGYPELLKECEDPPVGLYINSSTPADQLWTDRKPIAIVGT